MRAQFKGIKKSPAMLNVTKPRPVSKSDQSFIDIYNRLTEMNDHTGAAMMLVNLYGTKTERLEMRAIAIRHERDGEISMDDTHKRFELSNKYFKLLMAKHPTGNVL